MEYAGWRDCFTSRVAVGFCLQQQVRFACIGGMRKGYIMSTQKTDKSKWVLTGLVALLVIIVAVLCVMMSGMQKQLKQIGNNRSNAADSHPVYHFGAMDKSTPQKKPQAKPADPSNSMGDWFADAFDSDNWDPFAEMQRMQDHIDKMFSTSFGRFGKSQKYQDLVRDPVFSPEMDVHETDSAFIIQMDLPGVEEGKIDVNVDGQNVTISGKRSSTSVEKDENGKIIRNERVTGQFSRTIPLPGEIDAEHMKAENGNGVFTLTIPKK
jgi:HSP20 family protein